MSARWNFPGVAGLACLVLIHAGVLAGCGRQQPLSPIGPRAAATSSALSADDRGPVAPVLAANLDPVLQITRPRPSALLRALVPPTFTVHWEGSDPDARSNRPLEYRWILFDDPLEFFTFLANPDSLVRRDGPRFETWTPVLGNHTELELRDLTVGMDYLLVVVAIDEDGGFNRVFTLNSNMLRFSVGYPAALGPLVTVSGDVAYESPSGGLLDDPTLAPHFTIPMDRASTIQWTTRQAPGDVSNGTRWALDPTKILGTDQGAGREGGWSGWSLTGATATVGPFTTSGEHRFYIEARSAVGTLTRLLLVLDVVPPTEIAKARGE